jgi:hypothetical protein
MKTLITRAAALSAVVSSFLFAAAIPLEVQKLIPEKYNLRNPKWAEAKVELEDLIEQCGPGVIEGVSTSTKANNRCAFQTKLDDLFFEPPTGLLYDRDWAYRDGVTFFEPKAGINVPDTFDIRDLMKNGEPEMRKQKCNDCWAWATHHGLELARAVHDQKVLDHSVQTVVSCSRQGSCRSGGYMAAVDFLKYGLPLEAQFPYSASDEKCRFSTADIQSGWDGKIIAAPTIGNSLDYSRAHRLKNGRFRTGTKVQNIMKAMYEWKSPVVVTVASYSISGNGIYDSCSSINSGGNHMVTIVGWEMVDGKRIAHVWNSHGKEHGLNGVSRIQWECGDGKLNRGLGYSAKIVQYKPACLPPDASQKYYHETKIGRPVKIGAAQAQGTKCSWLPREGLSDPDSCEPMASPSKTTEYHLSAENTCGKSSSVAMVYIWDSPKPSSKGRMVMTPFGEVPLD